MEVTRDHLNAVVKAFAARDRSAAVAILAKFGVLTTAELRPEDWRAVFEACTEALNTFEAAP